MELPHPKSLNKHSKALCKIYHFIEKIHHENYLINSPILEFLGEKKSPSIVSNSLRSQGPYIQSMEFSRSEY